MSIGITYTGVDGSLWNLRAGPVVAVMEAMEGLGDPKWTRPVQSTPSTDGQRRTNPRSTASARSGFLPVDLIPQADELTWLFVYRQWWNAWHPDKAGLLTVTAPDGGKRFLKIFLEDDGNYAPVVDPSEERGGRVNVSWIADDPWWFGPTRRQTLFLFGAGDFFNNGTAPDFIISSSSTEATIFIQNPGDIPVWPRFTISEGAESFVIEVDGHRVAGNIVIPPEHRLEIDTRKQLALLIGPTGDITNVTGQLTDVDFAQIQKLDGSELSDVPIEDGAETPYGSAVYATLTGDTSSYIEMDFDPIYRRAF